jgi:hypothetical protein
MEEATEATMAWYQGWTRFMIKVQCCQGNYICFCNCCQLQVPCNIGDPSISQVVSVPLDLWSPPKYQWYCILVVRKQAANCWAWVHFEYLVENWVPKSVKFVILLRPCHSTTCTKLGNTPLSTDEKHLSKYWMLLTWSPIYAIQNTAQSCANLVH